MYISIHIPSLLIPRNNHFLYFHYSGVDSEVTFSLFPPWCNTRQIPQYKSLTENLNPKRENRCLAPPLLQRKAGSMVVSPGCLWGADPTLGFSFPPLLSDLGVLRARRVWISFQSWSSFSVSSRASSRWACLSLWGKRTEGTPLLPASSRRPGPTGQPLSLTCRRGKRPREISISGSHHAERTSCCKTALLDALSSLPLAEAVMFCDSWYVPKH